MKADISSASVPSIASGLGAPVAGSWKRWVSFVKLAWAIRAERNLLASLDDRMLKDIGLSRSLAEREIARELFDVPMNRLPRR